MKDKILQADGDELSRLLGEVLTEGPYRHKWNPENSCVKCSFDDRNPHNGYDANCPIPDPIPIDDWNVAMKWRDWAVAEYGCAKYKDALLEICVTEKNYRTGTFTNWIATKIKAHHYLQAAAICNIEQTLTERTDCE